MFNLPILYAYIGANVGPAAKTMMAQCWANIPTMVAQHWPKIVVLAHARYGTGDTMGGSLPYGTGSFESTKQFVKWLQYVCHLRWKINQVHLLQDTNFY